LASRITTIGANGYQNYGEERIKSLQSLEPPKQLLNLIAKNMRTVT